MSKNLKSNQLAAIPLLAAGMRANAVAKTVGVTAETVSRWRREPAFKAALEEEHYDALEATRCHMRAALPKAMEFVTQLIGNEKAHMKHRLDAAKKVLDQCKLDTPGEDSLSFLYKSF